MCLRQGTEGSVPCVAKLVASQHPTREARGRGLSSLPRPGCHRPQLGHLQPRAAVQLGPTGLQVRLDARQAGAGAPTSLNGR